MKKTKERATLWIAALAVLGSGLAFYYQYSMSAEPSTTVVAVPTVTQENGKTVQSFTLTAKKQRIALRDGETVTAWTYDGSVPGTQIRVTEGNIVRVTLINDLDAPTSIHWHGLPVPNNMDGIPGVTQNAIQPGETFTYEFPATPPGTYWYHSHQNSVVQEDMGLYGSIIIEPKQQTVQYDQDITLVLDEWMTDMTAMDHSGHGMSHGSDTDESHADMMKKMYDVFTVNGRAGDSIQPLEVKQGERVKLRLINAGFQNRLLHLANTPFKITHTDGQPISNPTELTDQVLSVAPGERYDVEFTGDRSFWIDDHNDSEATNDFRIPVLVDGKQPAGFAETLWKRPTVDITAYGKPSSPSEQKKYDIDYFLALNNKSTDEGEVYTINGKVYPNIEPLKVKKDQWVKVTMKNEGTADHPMHLHGHFFQVLTLNGQPIAGGITEKDTLNVRPGETYEVAFKADNEGEWMFHCHELHHAAAGMMTHVEYEGHHHFVPDPNAGNISE